MIGFLCEVKCKVDEVAIWEKLKELSSMEKFEKRYKRILNEGFKENPPPEPEKIISRGRKRKGKVLCLLERLRDYQKETLLFRSFRGAEQFCLIRSFISTVKKQGFSVIDALERIPEGERAYLNFSFQIAE